MVIKKTVEGTHATLAIDGWLDTETAPELGTELANLGEDIKSLTLDLSSLDYVSSAGIRQIVTAYMQMDGNLTVCNVKPEILEVLKITGVAKRLNIA